MPYKSQPFRVVRQFLWSHIATPFVTPIIRSKYAVDCASPGPTARGYLAPSPQTRPSLAPRRDKFQRRDDRTERDARNHRSREQERLADLLGIFLEGGAHVSLETRKYGPKCTLFRIFGPEPANEYFGLGAAGPRTEPPIQG